MAHPRKLRVPSLCLLLAVACASPPTPDEAPIEAVQLGGTVGQGNWFDAWQSTTAIHTSDIDHDAVADLQIRMRRGPQDYATSPQVGSLLLAGRYAGSQGAVQWTIAAFDGSRAEGSTRMMLATDGFSVLLPDLPAELAEQFEDSDDPVAPLALALGRHLHGVVGVVVTGPRDEPVVADKQVPEEGQYKCAVEQGWCDYVCTGVGIAVDVYIGTAGAKAIVKVVRKVVDVKVTKKVSYTARVVDPEFPGQSMPQHLTLPGSGLWDKVKAAAATIGGGVVGTYLKVHEYLDYVDPTYWCNKAASNIDACKKTGGGGSGGDGDGDGDGYCPDEPVYEDTGEESDESFSSNVTEDDHDCCDDPNGEFCDYADTDECDPPTECWEECYWNSWDSCGNCEWECGYSGCAQGCDWDTGNCWEDQPFDFDQCWNECYWDNWGHCSDCEWQCGGSGCWQGCDWGSGNCWEDYDYYS